MLLEKVSVVVDKGIKVVDAVTGGMGDVVAVVVVDRGAIVDKVVDAVNGGVGDVEVVVVDKGAIVDKVVDAVNDGMVDVSVVAVVGLFDVEKVD